MSLAIVSLLFGLISALITAEAYSPFNYPAQKDQLHFHAALPYPSMTQRVRPADVDYGRLFIATVTLTLSTVTTTTTAMAVTTCTTSTAALVSCVAGRRRRRHFVPERSGRSLFYDDDEVETEQGTSFLPKPTGSDEIQLPRGDSQLPVYPVLIEPGWNAPENGRRGRLLMAFATSTVTATTTSTSTAVLIATCNSISSFRTCV